MRKVFENLFHPTHYYCIILIQAIPNIDKCMVSQRVNFISHQELLSKNEKNLTILALNVLLSA